MLRMVGVGQQEHFNMQRKKCSRSYNLRFINLNKVKRIEKIFDFGVVIIVTAPFYLPFNTLFCIDFSECLKEGAHCAIIKKSIVVKCALEKE